MGSLLMGSLLMGSLTGRLVPGNRDDDNLEFHVHDCDSCPVAASGPSCSWLYDSFS